MDIELLAGEFSVCKLATAAGVDIARAFTFLSVTDREMSLVCETARVPEDAVSRSDGWRMLRVAGVLDFALTGVLVGISGALADAEVSIFAVSTYDTDYMLVRVADVDKAVRALDAAGYGVV